MKLPALLLAAQSPASQPAPSPDGLWIGPVQLCRDAVRSVRVGADPLGGPAPVTFRLTAPTRRRIATLTRTLVGEVLPVWLDGEVLTAPVVQEPLTGSEVTLSHLAVDRLRAAALGDCARAEPAPAFSAEGAAARSDR